MSEKHTPKGKVGYCQPPRKHQWKKGQSGNPRGRPPKKHLKPLYYGVDPVARSLLELDDKKLSVRTPEGEIEMRRSEAVWEKVLKLALNGNLKASEFYIAALREAWAEVNEAKAAMYRFAVEHHENYAHKFRLAEARGKPPPKIYPHPDDIRFDEEGNILVDCPINHWQQAQMEEWLSKRDECDHLLYIYDHSPELMGEVPAPIIKKLRQNRQEYNRALPRRLQLAPPHDWPSED